TPHALSPLSLPDALPISARAATSKNKTPMSKSWPWSRQIHQFCPVASPDHIKFRVSVQTLSQRCLIPSCIPRSIPQLLKNPYRRSEEHTSELQSRFDLVC